jgi:hypothetical protein
MRVLTKSRFKLGLQCPNKLFFTSNKAFTNAKHEDNFLAALAKGGFQVEELAKLHYPQGISVDGPLHEYEARANETALLLNQENAIIYEAAFLVGNWFVRTDILIKSGNHIKIVEVKAKGFHPEDAQFVHATKPRSLQANYKSYILDLAFQTFVVRQALPHCQVDATFLMADKSKRASINGLNQLFRIHERANQFVREARVSSLQEIGESVLTEVPMTSLVNQILDGEFDCYESMNFVESVQYLTKLYVNGTYANSPLKYSTCRKCEFKKEKHTDSGLSGLEYCFGQKQICKAEDLYQPNIFEVGDLRGKGQDLLDARKFLKSQVEENDLKMDPANDHFSSSERKWIQIQNNAATNTSPIVKKENLHEVISTWKFPYHFIDFETSTVALPFMKDMRPYEQIAFQYSHHIMHEDGKVEHAGQLLIDGPGVFPNFEFVRSLKKELEQDQGTIFRFSHHENTILGAIRKQLLKSNESDRDELIAFIESITKSGEGEAYREGPRCMVDLCDIAKRYYYQASQNGSYSIKAVLPAMLESSAFLQNKYAQPISAVGLSSLNFAPHHIWATRNENGKIDPYQSLDPIFKEWDALDMEDNLSDMEDLADGGAALTAYSKLQFTDMKQEERLALRTALLKYCELDTLAMVMLVEGWRG